MDGVCGDPERSQLERQSLGKADQPPLRRGIRDTVRIAETPCQRRHHQDRASRGLLQQRNGALSHHERPGQIDADDGIPCIDRVIDDRGRGTGDAGIVDEYVETTQLCLHIIKERPDPWTD